MTLLLLLALTQDPEALVERLRSGSPAERDAAVKSLKDLGEQAEPALKKAAEDADVDVAAPAKRLLDRLAIERSLTPRMKKTFPGLADRLATSELAWAETLAAAAELTRQPGGLKNADLAPLADRALRAPAPAATIADLAGVVEDRGIREGIPALARRAVDADERVAQAARVALHRLPAHEAVPLLTGVLGDGSERERILAASALGELEAEEAIPSLRGVLKHPSAKLKLAALSALDRARHRARRDPEVAGLLRDPDALVRAAAVALLGEMGAREELAGVRGALRDDDEKVRRRAIGALAELEGKGSSADLLAMLRDPAGANREAAVGELGRMRAETALDAIRQAAESDPDESVRRSAAWELHRFPGTGSVFARIAREGSASVRRIALLGLESRQAAEALPALAEALRAPQADVRLAAEGALGAWKDPAAADLVRPLLDDPDSEIRWAAVCVLAARKDGSMAGRIREGLKDASRTIRLRALHAASLLNEAGLSEAVTRLLGDEERDVAREAVRVLGETRIPASIPVLLDLLSHPSDEVRWDAVQKLWETPAPEAFGPVRKLLQDPSPRVTTAAVGLLAAYRVGEAAPGIRALLASPAPEVSGEAAEGLGALGAKGAAPDIVRLAEAAPFPVRRRAIDALVVLEHPCGPELVARWLRDEDGRVRASACLAAGAWKLRALELDLTDLLEDGESEVRLAAVEGLRRLGSTARSAELAARLQDRSEAVRWAAAQALGGFRAAEFATDVVRSLGDRRNENEDAEAAWILRDLGVDRGGAMEALLASPRSRDRSAAARAIGLAGKAEALAALVRATADPQSSVRQDAVQALGRLGDPAGMEAVLAAFRDPDEHVRWRAAQAAGFLGASDDARKALLEACRDRNVAVRGVAYENLVRVDARRSVPAFIEGLSDPADWVSSCAALGLAAAGGEEALAALRSWNRGDVKPRSARAEALSRAGVDDGVDELIGQDVRLQALNAVRSPELWKKLASTPWKGPRLTRCGEALAAIAEQSGLLLDVADRAKRTHAVLIPPGATLLEALETAYAGPCWILDGGRLRCVTIWGARDFWRAWAAGRKKK
jgi:HEAT repeat protein